MFEIEDVPDAKGSGVSPDIESPIKEAPKPEPEIAPYVPEVKQEEPAPVVEEVKPEEPVQES